MTDQNAAGSASPNTPAGSVSPTGQTAVPPILAPASPATDERIIGELKAKIEAAEKEAARIGRLLSEQQARTGDATAQAAAAKAEAEKLTKEHTALATSAAERDVLVGKVRASALENALAAKVILPDLVAKGLTPAAEWYGPDHSLTAAGQAAVAAYVATLPQQLLKVPTGGAVPPPPASAGQAGSDMASVISKYSPLALIYKMQKDQEGAK
jgi:hypothetical protein